MEENRLSEPETQPQPIVLYTSQPPNSAPSYLSRCGSGNQRGRGRGRGRSSWVSTIHTGPLASIYATIEPHSGSTIFTSQHRISTSDDFASDVLGVFRRPCSSQPSQRRYSSQPRPSTSSTPVVAKLLHAICDPACSIGSHLSV